MQYMRPCAFSCIMSILVNHLQTVLKLGRKWAEEGHIWKYFIFFSGMSPLSALPTLFRFLAEFTQGGMWSEGRSPARFRWRAGITTFSPLVHFGAKAKGAAGTTGVVGFGGLGHMAVKIAKAMGRSTL